MTGPNNKIIINFIISCLEKGEQRGKILVKTGKKWGISKSAFDRKLKIAKNELSIKQAAIEKEIAKVDEQAAIDARKKAIMGSEERKKVLTEIAAGKIEIPYSEVKWDRAQNKFVTIALKELPSHTARISAISELNKMGGDYAPTKIATTDKEGNDVERAPLTEDQLEKYLIALRASKTS